MGFVIVGRLVGAGLTVGLGDTIDEVVVGE